MRMHISIEIELSYKQIIQLALFLLMLFPT